MGLAENLLRGIYAYGKFQSYILFYCFCFSYLKMELCTLSGFEKPSAIQQRGIVPFCKGLDVIQQAQSGTGKVFPYQNSSELIKE